MDKLGIVLLSIILGLLIALLGNIHETKELITNQTIESYEQEITELKQKKNTLMLICLEKGKKRPNKQLLDSLEINYYLD